MHHENVLKIKNQLKKLNKNFFPSRLQEKKNWKLLEHIKKFAHKLQRRAQKILIKNLNFLFHLNFFYVNKHRKSEKSKKSLFLRKCFKWIFNDKNSQKELFNFPLNFYSQKHANQFVYNLPISLFLSNARLQIDSLKISIFNEYYHMCWYIDSILILFLFSPILYDHASEEASKRGRTYALK